MWRWSSLAFYVSTIAVVFSTYVEVILKYTFFLMVASRFLHVCGGDPEIIASYNNLSEFSPRMWRWSLLQAQQLTTVIVFSTYVEVILTSDKNTLINLRFLHVCGGDPTINFTWTIIFLFSPRMWRWSLPLAMKCQSGLVFSTYVEVILKLSLAITTYLSFLHVCGGDPYYKPSS